MGKKKRHGYWKGKKPPFYKYWLGKKRPDVGKKISESKKLFLELGLSHPVNEGKKLSKKWKKNMSIARTKFFQDKRNRKRWSIMTSRIYAQRPEIKEKISKKIEERYKAHPYLRKEESRRKLLYYEQHPEARRHLLEYWKKHERRVKAIRGLIVKSEGERFHANMFFRFGIKPNYEAVELNFPEMDPCPDFFPEGNFEGRDIKNVFVEFYGGFPQEWKRKVQKNKLYKKYRIPVIPTNPAELEQEDAEKRLLREMVRLSESRLARNFNLERWQLDRGGKILVEQDK